MTVSCRTPLTVMTAGGLAFAHANISACRIARGASNNINAPVFLSDKGAQWLEHRTETQAAPLGQWWSYCLSGNWQSGVYPTETLAERSASEHQKVVNRSRRR